MPLLLRLRKLLFSQPSLHYTPTITHINEHQQHHKSLTTTKKNNNNKKKKLSWRSCIDCYCWFVGYLCTTWWLLLLLYTALPSALPVLESPGHRLKHEGLHAHHPVVLVPGIVTGALELWEGRPCAHGLFRQRLWGGSFSEILKRPLCWLEHMSLDNETGMDPPGIRVRPIPGLVAADYFTPGYFVWAVLIENLARIGYEDKNLHMATYDWRLSFHNTEVRDQSLSILKSRIELMVRTNGDRKVVVVPHSMGVLYFLHFMKWVEAPAPFGSGGGPDWCAKHIKAIINIGPAFLGVPKAVTSVFSAETKDVAFARAVFPGLLNSNLLGFQTLPHILRIARTWDSMISLLPKGGETIWGNIDWSPEGVYHCDLAKRKLIAPLFDDKAFSSNRSDGRIGFRIEETTNYGRMISFSSPSAKLSTCGSKEHVKSTQTIPMKSSACRETWTKFNDMNEDQIRSVAENKVYTARTVHDLLRFVAPKLMQRANAHFSYGIADDLDDPKYSHYKYWSNPLETKLPDAPEMEIYCYYGVGIPTERSYVYKLSQSSKCNNIPFQIDSSVDGNERDCLRGGVYFVDGDESVPSISAGFMCAKGWRGKTRFNPSGLPTYVREYWHRPPSNLLGGRGKESGAHVDILGNAAIIEDIMRVAAGANADEIGGDQILSDIMKISEHIKLHL
ncbi:hypothetical protein J5N97_022080 [Dioscorea zingiberensis]|uniref:Phospholipid:diacylglycerol acyltransferase 2 n=1 Tax=Dioscorea zingiberensis TaxID=325984 RepID=A0A9D5CAH3_9LILI|nr:hypothetical protein J5N97_022080 [Dioscorea zingiberensis]